MDATFAATAVVMPTPAGAAVVYSPIIPALALLFVAVPTIPLVIVAVVPINRAFWDDIPPAVMIEPVVELVASVVSVELTPSANGIRAVVAVCPSFVMAVVRPVARSVVRALNAVLVMVVPVMTG